MSDAHNPDTESEVRHILSLSGGKDSTALALYLRDRIPSLAQLRQFEGYSDANQLNLHNPLWNCVTTNRVLRISEVDST